MEKISHSLNQRPTVRATTGFNEVKPTVRATTGRSRAQVKLTKQEVLGCDVGLSQYSDVMSPRFYKWYCQAWYDLGREKFHQLASQARADGKHPAKLFSKLVKDAVSNI